MNRSLLCLLAILVFAAASVFADHTKNSSHTYSHNAYGEKMVEGSDNIVSQTRDVKSFTRLETDMGIDLFITVGKPLSVKISFDDNLVDFVDTKVHGETLEITTRKAFTTHNQCRAEITVPSLEELIFEGSGDIEIMGMQGDEFAYTLEGAGNLHAMGIVDQLYIQISGSGNVDTREVKAHNVKVDIDGNGNAKVFADEEFDGSIDGVGNISYYGDPKQAYKNVNGMGKIRQR